MSLIFRPLNLVALFVLLAASLPLGAQEAPPKKKPAPSTTSTQTKPASGTGAKPGGSPQTGKPSSATKPPATGTSGSNSSATKKPTGTETKPANGSQTDLPKPKPVGVIETLQGYLARMSVKTDKPQTASTNTLVTHYPFDKDTKNKEIDLVVVYMPTKKMIGFYTYEFGNSGKAKDQMGLFKALLNLNDRLAVGSFFVDKDQDIGLKFALRTESNVSFDEFQSVYFAMIAAVRQYRGQVTEFFDPSAAKSAGDGNDKEGDTRQRRVKQR